MVGSFFFERNDGALKTGSEYFISYAKRFLAKIYHNI